MYYISCYFFPWIYKVVSKVKKKPAQSVPFVESWRSRAYNCHISCGNVEWVVVELR